VIKLSKDYSFHTILHRRTALKKILLLDAWKITPSKGIHFKFSKSFSKGKVLLEFIPSENKLLIECTEKELKSAVKKHLNRLFKEIDSNALKGIKLQ
jgi:Txe/YoeB family toxin of Txe-Axe toxin-antitoxin module